MLLHILRIVLISLALIAIFTGNAYDMGGEKLHALLLGLIGIYFVWVFFRTFENLERGMR